MVLLVQVWELIFLYNDLILKAFISMGNYSKIISKVWGFGVLGAGAWPPSNFPQIRTPDDRVDVVLRAMDQAFHPRGFCHRM